MTAIKVSKFGTRSVAALLAGTMLAGAPAWAQTAPAAPAATPAAAPAPAAPVAAVVPPVVRVIKTLRVEGSQRIEPDTVLSYTKLRVGQPYTNESLDQAIKDLFASDFFADVSISGADSGDIVLRIKENPVINRVILEGNKRLKNEKITKEIKLAPRQIFTRTAVRQDVARIIELYRRQGRFAASVDPKMVALDQNRVDIVFEISEGPKSKVRAINIIGNEVFSDDKLRGEMATKQARLLTLLSPNTSYDQDRLAYDQQKLRQFYLTEGYADFRVTSAVAELTPDKRDFIITYVVEEGQRYKFGDVSVDSDIRDFNNKALAASTGITTGSWYNAKKVEDSVDALSEAAGLYGYAFTDVKPEFNRDRETLTMGINFHIAEAKRSYVERVDVNGNTNTQDKVVRREIRLSEGDAFNSFQVKRSQDRINSLGFFQDKLEIKQSAGSAPDRVVLTTNVEEKSTGELSLSAGYSSLEKFIIQASIRQRNFRGKGQELRASVNYSTYQKSVELGFTEPYLFDKNIAIGGDIFRRDYNSFNLSANGNRNTTYTQVSTGFQVRAGLPLTEYWSASLRYGLTFDDIRLDRATYYDAAGNCQGGRYFCDAVGNRATSSVGASLLFDSLNSRLRPTAGQRFVVSGDFAGLGGDVRYARARAEGAKYWGIGGGFVLSASGEGGAIVSLEKSRGPGIDRVRITDRYYLGEPEFRGFDIRGVGPRVQTIPYVTDATGVQSLITDRNRIIDDALGGRYYYSGRLELEVPLGAGARELGLRPSIYIQAGALFGVTRPLPTIGICAGGNTTNCFPSTVDSTGRVTVLPLFTPSRDTSGRPLYSFTQADGSLVATTCAAGLPDSTGACNGITPNTAVGSTTQPYLERFVGNSAKPRLSVGAGVNWNSPFGPLRIDLAYALLKETGDDTKLVTFNVGTQF